MIRNSFIFLEKIGAKGEQNLWKKGIADWNSFLKTECIRGISSRRKQYYDRRIKEAQKALGENESSFFMGKLPLKETWRLYGYFKEECCFLDIEIDGYGQVILVGISNYYNTNFFVQGVNLEKTMLEKELSNYALLVTFNGSSFDLPRLKKQLHLSVNIPHLDLKPLCVNLGLTGGLKEIEKKLNLKRPTHLQGNPVELWHAFHASGDRDWLDLLIEYNREDCENLKNVADHVVNFLNSKMSEKLNS